MMQTIVPHGTDESAPVGNSTLTFHETSRDVFTTSGVENSAMVGNSIQPGAD
jgi:hypothetical protein